MFVRLFLKSDQHLYTYEDVNLVYLGRHKFPSGKDRRCLTLVLDGGTTVNFAFSEVGDLIVENYLDERHPYNDDAKIIFVEDGQPFEKRYTNG